MLKLTSCQGKIFAFALSLLGDREAAADIQQETNLTIWSKAEEAKDIKNFSAWAMKITYFLIKNHRRRQQRSMLLFDSDIMELLAEDSAKMADEMDYRTQALHGCMQSLSEKNRLLLEERYHHGYTVKEIAERLSRTKNSIAVTLFRIRSQLHQCIQQRLSKGCGDE